MDQSLQKYLFLLSDFPIFGHLPYNTLVQLQSTEPGMRMQGV